MTALRTRKPTGAVAWPLLLVEGAEKTGKSYASFALSASPKVGRTFVFDFGEGTADEYAALGPYEVIDHDGTFADFIAQLKAATEIPQVDGKPNVIVIDSATVLWESIKDWADGRARKSKKAQTALRNDPDADISIPMNLWTDAGERWGQMTNALRYWPGIGVLIARGKEVAKVDGNGTPVTGQTEYKVEAHKSIGYAVSARVRCEAPKRAVLTEARSLHADIPPRGLLLPEANPLEHVVFDILGAGSEFAVSSAVLPQATDAPVIDKVDADRLVALMKAAADPDEIKKAWHTRFGVWPSALPVTRLAEADDFLSDLEVTA